MMSTFKLIMIIYRGVFDRQDSLRSDYLSDRETRYGIVQQASIDSTDSRLCYLTSSEVSDKTFTTFSTPNPPQRDEFNLFSKRFKNYIFAIHNRIAWK